MPLLKDDFGVQIYVFDPALLIGTGFRTVRCTPTPTTMSTTWSTATSRCNSAPWHHRRLIFVSTYIFLTIPSWFEQISELSEVHQHHKQCQQQGPWLLQGITQLPRYIEGWFWSPDICFWPFQVNWNKLFRGMTSSACVIRVNNIK